MSDEPLSLSAPILRARRAEWYDGVEFFIVSQDRKLRVKQVLLERAQDPESAAAMMGPSFRVGDAAAQVLMDDLWHSGFRPTEGTGSAGSLAATQRHLADMRALVFKLEASK